MVSILVPILVRLLLAGIDRDHARQYIKNEFSGFKERALLAVFDTAWALAEAAVGDKKGSVAFTNEQGWLESTKIAMKATPDWQVS